MPESDEFEYFEFLNEAHTIYHVCQFFKKMLLDKGYVELDENAEWSEIPDKFFVLKDFKHFFAGKKKGTLNKGVIYCSNYKTNAYVLSDIEQKSDKNSFLQSSLVVVGVPIGYCCRDLSIAGIVNIMKNGKIESKIVTGSEPIGVISGSSISHSQDHFIVHGKSPFVMKYVADLCGCEESDIISHELHLIDTCVPTSYNSLVVSRNTSFLSILCTLDAFISNEFEHSSFFTMYEAGQTCSLDFARSILKRIGCKSEFYEKSFCLKSQSAGSRVCKDKSDFMRLMRTKSGDVLGLPTWEERLFVDSRGSVCETCNTSSLSRYRSTLNSRSSLLSEMWR